MKSNSRFPPSRYYPYARKISSANEEMKEVVVGLGVELSVYVAEAMFLLCDDIDNLLGFCYKLWKCAIHPSAPVSKRLLRVIYHVYSKDIKPKNGAYQDSAPFQLISTTWKDFCDGIIVLHRLVKILQEKDSSFDDQLLSSAIAKYKQLLKSLEDKLGSAKHVSEANGFVREMIESNISHLWKSLFAEEESVDLWTSDEDAPAFEEATPKLITILHNLLQPIMDKPWLSSTNPKAILRHSEIKELPTFSSHMPPLYSPYILGKDFALEKLREEVVGLGVELSLYVAESMFLLSDDTHCMSPLFCHLVQTCMSPVRKCMLRVIHYVNSEYIKPENAVCQNGVHSVQCVLISQTWELFVVGFRDLDILTLLLGRGSCLFGRKYTSSVEEALEKLGESLRCVRDVRDVSEANGFPRDVMVHKMLKLWESVFDKETEEA